VHPQLGAQRAGRGHAQPPGRQARQGREGAQRRQRAERSHQPASRSKHFAAGIDTGRPTRSKSWDEFSREGAPPLSIVITVCDSAAAEACPVFFGGTAGPPVKVHWGYPDPSNAEGGDEGRRRAFELTRQAIGYRMLQLLALPLGAMDRQALQAALVEIGHS
jgi:protein-tyrosine-phosphatase